MPGVLSPSQRKGKGPQWVGPCPSLRFPEQLSRAMSGRRNACYLTIELGRQRTGSFRREHDHSGRSASHQHGLNLTRIAPS
jgi:hypothetical protein